MVGNKGIRYEQMNLATVTAKYIGKPFKEHGCIDFVVDFMRDIGKPLPESVDGIDAANYNDLVRADIKQAQVTMLRAFRKIGEPSSTKYPRIGDLLVIYQRHSKSMYPAVAIGNGMGIASFIRHGVSCFNIGKWDLPIMARRVD